MKRKTIVTGLLLGTLSGCLWFMACPPNRFFYLAWFAMVPVMFALDRVQNWKQAAIVSWIAGSVATAGGFYWMVTLMQRFAGMPFLAAVAVYAIFCLYQGITFLLFGVTTRAIRQSTALPMVLVAPIVFVAFEWVVPLLFPFYVAITQAWHPTIIQIAEMTGPLGVSALLLLANATLYDALHTRGRALKPVTAGVCVIATVLLFGVVRIRQVDKAAAGAPMIKVGAIQGNVAYNEKGEKNPALAPQQLRELQEHSQKLEAAGAQLIVWSETAYPHWFPRELKQDLPEPNDRRFRRGFSAPLIAGSVTFSAGPRVYNSALFFDSNGNITGHYDKVELLAFGEALPTWLDFEFVRKVVPQGFGHFVRGTGPKTLPFELQDKRRFPISTVICYEDIIPQYLRRVGALHPFLLVNITNDSWYGARTEPWEHLALAVFGSVEQRTSMVRVVNSGVTAFIDPVGRVRQTIDPVDPSVTATPAESMLAEVPLLQAGNTVYAKVGDMFAYACIALTAILLRTKPHVKKQIKHRH
ncbi:MAG TPA: apolipoprotein N-acyltransferase [Terriglobales bacterium]